MILTLQTEPSTLQEQILVRTEGGGGEAGGREEEEEEIRLVKMGTNDAGEDKLPSSEFT